MVYIIIVGIVLVFIIIVTNHKVDKYPRIVKNEFGDYAVLIGRFYNNYPHNSAGFYLGYLGKNNKTVRMYAELSFKTEDEAQKALNEYIEKKNLEEHCEDMNVRKHTYH